MLDLSLIGGLNLWSLGAGEPLPAPRLVQLA